MASQVQVPSKKKKKKNGQNSYGGKKEAGSAVVNKESMTFHWLSATVSHWMSCGQERRGSLSSSC